MQSDKNFLIEKINLEGLEGIEAHLHIHKADSDKVLIMYPGADGSIEGYNEKYKKIADLIQSKNIANVVRIDNKYNCIVGVPYCELMINKIAQIVEHIQDNAGDIFGNDKIEIYLSGVSAGASAIATILEEFPIVKKVLFIAPAESVGIENIARGLKNYQGEIYLVAGADDEIKTFDSAKNIMMLLKLLQKKNCL